MRIIDWSSDVCSSDLLRDHSESESRYAEPSKRSKGTRPKDSHALSWTLTDRTPARLELVWRERGGPPVLPPERAGFGTRMLEQVLAQELRGTVRQAFRPDGLVCVISVPRPSAQVG